jgi:ribosomal RNA-processing protein 9
LWRIDEEKRALSELLSIPVVGVVNSLQFANDGSFIVASVSKEPRLGRWTTVKEAVNSVRVFVLPIKR